MSQPLAHLYELALRTLDDQERRADALRGRLGPIIAAAALGVTLLSGPVIGGAHPGSVGGKLALLLAVGGLLLSTAAAFRLLGFGHRPSEALDPRHLTDDLVSGNQLDDEAAFYAAMVARIGKELDDRDDALDRLATTFTAMLWGILLMLCGLALAALVG